MRIHTYRGICRYCTDVYVLVYVCAFIRTGEYVGTVPVCMYWCMYAHSYVQGNTYVDTVPVCMYWCDVCTFIRTYMGIGTVPTYVYVLVYVCAYVHMYRGICRYCTYILNFNCRKPGKSTTFHHYIIGTIPGILV